MAWSDLWALEMLLAAFAGGAFGAALGILSRSVWVPTLGFRTVGNDRPSDYFLWLTLSR